MRRHAQVVRRPVHQQVRRGESRVSKGKAWVERRRPLVHLLRDALGRPVLAKPTAQVLVPAEIGDRKSTRLNSSHSQISYAVFCLKKKNKYSIRRVESQTIL